MCRFWLAVDHFRDAENLQLKIKCNAFGPRGTATHRYMSKGDYVAVAGELVQDRFVARDGTRVNTVEMQCSRVVFLRNARRNMRHKPKWADTPDVRGGEGI